MQNKTLAESDTNGVTVYLFESFENNSYIYRGIVKLAGEPYYEKQKDWLGYERQVVKFPLKVVE
jgi:5-methylcytosine-specific restriction protein A